MAGWSLTKARVRPSAACTRRSTSSSVAGEAEFARGEMGGMIGAQIEDRRHLPLFAARAHERGVAAPAERQHEGVEEDGFARARLAGESRQPLPEIEIERVDEHDVADGQTNQHDAGDFIAPTRRRMQRLSGCAVILWTRAPLAIAGRALNFKLKRRFAAHVEVGMADDEINEIRALLSSKPASGRLGGAARADRGGRRRLAARAGYPARARPDRRSCAEWSLAPGVDPVPSSCFISRRRLLLGLDRQPPPHGDGGGPRGRRADARRRLSGSRPSTRSPPPMTTRSPPGAFCARKGSRREHIAVGGDSAGGGLSLALAMRLREAGEAGPGCLWLCSPWTDLTMSGETIATKDAVDPLIHKAYLEELAARLCARRRRPQGPARLAALWRFHRPAANAHSGRFRRDVACGFDALRCRGRRGGRSPSRWKSGRR